MEIVSNQVIEKLRELEIGLTQLQCQLQAVDSVMSRRMENVEINLQALNRQVLSVAHMIGDISEESLLN